jgi:hypothetical protein
VVAVLVGVGVSSAFAQPSGVGSTLVVKPLAEKKVAELAAGPLFWRVESFATVVCGGGKRWLKDGTTGV